MHSPALKDKTHVLSRVIDVTKVDLPIVVKKYFEVEKEGNRYRLIRPTSSINGPQPLPTPNDRATPLPDGKELILRLAGAQITRELRDVQPAATHKVPAGEPEIQKEGNSIRVIMKTADAQTEKKITSPVEVEGAILVRLEQTNGQTQMILQTITPKTEVTITGGSIEQQDVAGLDEPRSVPKGQALVIRMTQDGKGVSYQMIEESEIK
jgi:hypothetical protein